MGFPAGLRRAPDPPRQTPGRRADYQLQKRYSFAAGAVCSACSRPVRRRCVPANRLPRGRRPRKERGHAPPGSLSELQPESARAAQVWLQLCRLFLFLVLSSLIYRSKLAVAMLAVAMLAVAMLAVAMLAVAMLAVAPDRDRTSECPGLRNSAARISVSLCWREKVLSASSLNGIRESCQHGAGSGEVPPPRRECDAPPEFWSAWAKIVRGHRCGRV